MDKTRQSPKKLLIGIGLIALAGITYIVTSRFRTPPSPQQVAQTALDCTLSSDYGCLWEYIPETERAIYGINRDQFIRIMDEYVARTLGKVKVMRRDINPIGIGQASAEAEVILPNGRTSRITIRTANTPTGVATVNLLATLVVLVQTFEAPETGEHRMKHWLARARSDGPRLSELGMKGLYRGPERGFETWDEWATKLETAIKKKAKASAASAR